MKNSEKALEILAERFGKDAEISLATLDGKRPAVRIVNSYYEDGAFYIITYAKSNKIKQIQKNPHVAICGEWFTANGLGENRGHVRGGGNTALFEKLREVFAAWIDNGDVDENDPHTCILKIRLTEGVLMSHGTRYEVKF